MDIEELRDILAAETGRDRDYPFFYASYDWVNGAHETGDEALLALFNAERVNYDSDHATVAVMVHG